MDHTAAREISILTHCYVCNRPFECGIVIDHGEHVIQNGIGGGLVAWGILCKACGANLGTSVDAPFYEALKPLCAVFDLRRERGGPVRIRARATLKDRFAGNGQPLQCTIEHGADPVPVAPTVIKDHDSKVAHVFGASPKQIRNYTQSPDVKELAADGYSVETGSRFGDFVDDIAVSFRPNAFEIARGILKIAISFALDTGVERGVIRHLVADDRDILADEGLVRDTVIPYYPTGWCEALYEADRYRTDDFPPNHQLTLFSLGTRLFCHVDLFGVIQRYVLLSDAWTGGPMMRRYLQKCPKWIFDAHNWHVRRPKDLDILARQFGVPTAGRSFADIQQDILTKAASRPYELPAAGHLAKPGAMLAPLATLPVEQLRRFETTKALVERAEVAKAHFESDVLTAVVTERLRVLTYLRDRNPSDFRVVNELGECPDLCGDKPESDLASYQEFRLDAFVHRYASSWSIST